MIILGTNSVKDTGFDVANSVRFDDGASSYLQKSASSGNRRTFTFSTWLKRSNLTSGNPSYYHTFFSSDVSGSNSFRFTFNDDSGSDDDKLMVYYYTGSHQLKLITNRQFRDTSAWYHIVLAVDTTQGTSTNRVKIYVNGVQETDFASSSYPSQNLQTSVNESGAPTRVGAGTSLYFDGYMSETVLLDGTAASPTSFGEFDEDSGIWKPIDVSGLTFGTNGFHLNYENSSELGTDANGGTTLAETNLTALNQSTDTCTNNFATMNPLDNYRQAHAFSDGNLTVTTTNGSQSYSTSSILLTSGKWYVECKPVSGGSEPEIGIANKMVLLNAGNNAQVSYNANGYGYRASDPGTVWYNGEYVTNSLVTYANGDIIGIALDLDNNKLYFSKNGTFANSQDPTDGTNAVSIIDPASTEIGGYVFSCNETFNDQNKVFSWNFGSPPYAISSGNTDGNGHGNFEYAVPSGYLALCTKNLA